MCAYVCMYLANAFNFLTVFKNIKNPCDLFLSEENKTRSNMHMARNRRLPNEKDSILEAVILQSQRQ